MCVVQLVVGFGRIHYSYNIKVSKKEEVLFLSLLKICSLMKTSLEPGYLGSQEPGFTNLLYPVLCIRLCGGFKW